MQILKSDDKYRKDIICTDWQGNKSSNEKKLKAKYLEYESSSSLLVPRVS